MTEGAKGPREYEFARLRVIEKRHGEPGPWGWMMVRRPVGCRDPKEFKYYLSNAPETVRLERMSWVACSRWTVEEDVELGKGEVGLDHYEVTKCRGWYHYVTLALLALACLKSVQHELGEKMPATVPEVRELLVAVLPRRRWGSPSRRVAMGSPLDSGGHRLVRVAAGAEGGRPAVPSRPLAA